MRFEKLSAGMMMLVQDLSNGGAAAVGERAQLFGVRGGPATAGIPRTTVFIRTDPDEPMDDLEAEGIIVNQPTGAIRTADLPFAALEALSEDPRVTRIRSSQYLKPLLDVASSAVGVDVVRTRFGLDGQGVVVGVVDTGIDGFHGAFQGRIERVWDQTIRGQGVQEGRYGRELVAAAIGLATDEHGHGTHVAGIAAGAHAKFQGVAPAARLVIVKSDLLNAHIADGIRYIFRVAGELGLPAVVNLSLGGHADAHDGTDGLSETIEQESGPGRIVVCAAGNEGDDDIHALVDLGEDDEVVLPFRVPAVSDPAGRRIIPAPFLNGWYDGDDVIEIAVQSPNGHLTPFQGPIAGGPTSRSYDLPGAVVTIVTPPPSPDNDDHQFLVDIKNPLNGGGPEPDGVWQLRLRGVRIASGRVHVWALDNTGGSSVTFRGPFLSDGFKVGSPGCASSAITVASYTSRTRWTDRNGDDREIGMTPDTISSFSSEGPRRDEVEKPDLAAPGAMICSAASSQGTFEDAFHVDAEFRMEAGTSMASPFVAGIVALLLQRDGLAPPDEAKQLLGSTCSVPGAAAGAFDTKWGRGVFLQPALENMLGDA